RHGDERPGLSINVDKASVFIIPVSNRLYQFPCRNSRFAVSSRNSMDSLCRHMRSIFQKVWNLGIRTGKKEFHSGFPKTEVVFAKPRRFSSGAGIKVVILSLKSHGFRKEDHKSFLREKRELESALIPLVGPKR